MMNAWYKQIPLWIRYLIGAVVVGAAVIFVLAVMFVIWLITPPGEKIITTPIALIICAVIYVAFGKW